MTIRWYAGSLLLHPDTAMAALFGNLFAGSPPAGLGVADGRLAACSARPNCVSSQATDDAHRVAPFGFAGAGPEAMARLARVIAAQPGARIVEQRPDYIHATFATPLMGFVDDAEFLLQPERRIDVRSASRPGYSNLGVNRKWIEALRTAFAGSAA
jgi:uncharacterized protein (DUF1499 family)